MSTKRGLGRGLGSLIGPKSNFTQNNQTAVSTGTSQTNVIPEPERHIQKDFMFVNPADITENPYQPRTEFEEKSLNELALSIKEHGVLNPLIVCKTNTGYELISGERRLRAARVVGLARVPVIVRDATHSEKIELALIENIQREDLNAIDLAQSIKQFMDEFALTQEQVSKRLGKSRPQVANILRFLDLPHEIQASLAQGEITEGHAKIILSCETPEKQLQLWKKITLNQLTVRASEREAQHVRVKTHTRVVRGKETALVEKEEVLEAVLGTKVFIKGNKNKGQVVIEYFNEDELNGIVQQITL